MENLEGQYFEKVVSTLKKAKKSENINIRAEFKDELRDKLMKQANGLMLEDQQDSSFFDFILKYKYIFAGVPVLAVMALFSISLFDLKVKIPNEQVIPIAYEVGEINTQNFNNLEKIENFNSPSIIDVSENNESGNIKTFPAEMVMPSEEALLMAKERMQKNEAKEILDNQFTFEFGASGLYLPFYTIDEVNQDKTKIEMKNDELLTQKPMIIYSYPSNIKTSIEYKSNGVEMLNSLENGGMTKKITKPNELFNDEQVNSTDNAVMLKMDNDLTEVLNFNSGALMDSEKNDTQKVIEKERFDEMKNLNFDQKLGLNINANLNTVNEKINLNSNFLNLNKPLQINNQLLNQGLFKFDNTHIFTEIKINQELLTLVSEAFQNEKEHLGENYYIFVNLIGEKQYKAVLFINDKIKNSVVIGERDGKLVVLTQVVY